MGNCGEIIAMRLNDKGEEKYCERAKQGIVACKVSLPLSVLKSLTLFGLYYYYCRSLLW